jgi:CRISPR-associated exonuclease Cas4
MVQYYYVSKKELWYYANNIDVSGEDENVKIGRQIDKSSYDRETKHVIIDSTIAIDIVEDEDTIYEVKKSSRMEKPAKMQLKYYLWYLKNKKGIEMTGVLAYPEERKREEVELTPEDEEEIERVVEEIREIIKRPEPPEGDLEDFPKNSSYYEFFKV